MSSSVAATSPSPPSQSGTARSCSNASDAAAYPSAHGGSSKVVNIRLSASRLRTTPASVPESTTSAVVAMTALDKRTISVPPRAPPNASRAKHSEASLRLRHDTSEPRHEDQLQQTRQATQAG